MVSSGLHTSRPLKVAVLVDLLRTAEAGGHIRCWERLAQAAAHDSNLPLDLTVYFSGTAPDEILAPHVRFRHLPQMFSTARLKFLPYVPDHTDLAPYHPRLARELATYDLIHTTDGFFAFAQTAARVSRKRGIPLVTSFHTDTPSYARIFTRQTLDKVFARVPVLHRLFVETLKAHEKQERSMLTKLKQHVRQCRFALVTRQEDHDFAERLLGKEHVGHLRLGVDKTLFNTNHADRAAIEKRYTIPPDRIILLFVGRVDVGKNIYTLAEAIQRLVRRGIPLHLVVAGKGPAAADVKAMLGDHVSLPGYVAPVDLAQLYASVDGLALSSEVEIRRMAGVEAMASSCPVLVSAKSGVAELFNHTPAMRVVESGVDAWARAIENFASDTNQRARMKQAAQEYSTSYLGSWRDILLADVLSVWQRAVQQPTQAAL